MCSMSIRKPAEPARYRDSRIAVGTRHGKQHQLAPAFSEVLRARLITPPDLDTDRFGTFSGERTRRGPAIDTARAKARLAMDAGSLPLGLASEASYGPLPGAGWPGHEEILLFCDGELGIEVVEGHRSAVIPGAAHVVAPGADIPETLLAGLPHQALIVRPASRISAPDAASGISAPDAASGISKGLVRIDEVRAAVAVAAAVCADGMAVVEPDLRAQHNPSRRRVLTLLARRMAVRLATGCPACGTPGFGRVDSEGGLPCRVCETPTATTSAELLGCCSCSHIARRPVPAAAADPAHCPSCNP